MQESRENYFAKMQEKCLTCNNASAIIMLYSQICKKEGERMADQMDFLKEKIAAANFTQDSLAVKIGMNPSTLYRKIKGGGEGFTVGEIHRLVDELHLSDKEAQAIFLA